MKINYLKSPPKGMPSTVKILGQKWRVRYSPNLCIERGLLGLCLSDKRMVLVDSEQAPESMVDTLMHEVIHSCIAMTPMANMDQEQNEALVRSLTPAFISLLRSNAKWW